MNVEDLMKQAQIAAPCHVKWEDLTGDDKQRFCGDCKLNVLNAKAMTDEEVLQALLKKQNGERVCMQIYRRADGTILTQNCPKGIKLLRERARQGAAWFAGALSMLLSMAGCAAPGTQSDTTDKSKPKRHATVKVAPEFSTVQEAELGDVEITPTPEMTPTNQMISTPEMVNKFIADAQAVLQARLDLPESLIKQADTYESENKMPKKWKESGLLVGIDAEGHVIRIELLSTDAKAEVLNRTLEKAVQRVAKFKNPPTTKKNEFQFKVRLQGKKIFLQQL